MKQLRAIVFWAHLAVGLLCAGFVLLLCLTGATLAFELQLVNWAERDVRAAPPNAEARFLPPEEIVRLAKAVAPEKINLIQWHSDRDLPVHVFTDKRMTLKFNPYTGAFLGNGATGLREFMRLTTALHTHLNIVGWGHWFTAWANVGFTFLLLTGFWLWWPKSWRWANLRHSLKPRLGLPPKARDWNWHNSFGFWLLAPLIFISITGIALGFKTVDQWWRQYGGTTCLPPADAPSRPLRQPNPARNWPEWIELIDRRHPGWSTLVIHGDNALAKAPQLTVHVYDGTMRQARLAEELRVDLRLGQIIEARDWHTGDGPQKARSIVRLGHTGELFGNWGQVIALLAALGGLIVIITGVSLSWRRWFDKPNKNS